MKITFYGAAREVTGSRHLLEVNGKRILLDCGIFQGHRAEADVKNRELPFDPPRVDAVILSHAHMDHAGALPRLVKLGFNKTIYSTFATKDLCNFMLMDSAYIQEREAVYMNTKKHKKGTPLVEPAYTSEDAEETLKYFEGVAYEKPKQIFPGIEFTFYNSGHILGSALILLKIDDQEDGKTKTLLFTGDLGRKNLPILKDPVQVPAADFMISECTYGNRVHEDLVEVESKLTNIVMSTIQRGGKLIIPAFSLGRTQEIVYSLHDLFKKNLIPHDLPIMVDSPLSGNLTEVFRGHIEDFDKEAQAEFLNNRENPFGFGALKYTTSVEESKAIDASRVPMIVISAAGMCEFGRVLHHLKNNIENPSTTILIVGYMADNTLGRKIVEKQPMVNIFGDSYNVRARVEVIDAFSGHADRSDLLDYAMGVKGIQKMFLVHGEEKQYTAFSQALAENGMKNVEVPEFGQSFVL
ncbi:MAG: MBL fold metallo-hydrolase [Candidatus Gracilibacteria bacterium]